MSTSTEESLLQLTGTDVEATVSTIGAELRSLRSTDGHEYLWQAGPAWPRSAPILFPAICRQVDDRLLVRGRFYPLAQHGFARDHTFTVVTAARDRVVLRLVDEIATRRRYPFEFALTVTFTVHQSTLSVRFDVFNAGECPLPFAIGWHPAFAWPLDPRAPREGHTIQFDQDEQEPFRRVADNLLRPERFGSLISEGTLALREQHFADGALLLDRLHSRRLTYTAPTGRAVHMNWSNFSEFTVWSPVTADLICLEPWRGLPAPQGSAIDITNRDDLTHLQPGEQHGFMCQTQLVSV